MAKQELSFVSDDGKERSNDERFIDTYNLKQKLKSFFTENGKKLCDTEDAVYCSTVSEYMINDPEWFYDFFNHICCPESENSYNES